MRIAALLGAAALLSTLGACVTQPPAAPAPPAPPAPVFDDFSVEPLAYSALQGWAEDDHAATLRGFRNSCLVLADKGDSVGGLSAGAAPLFGAGADWLQPCAAALKAGDGDARAFFETWFTPASIGSAGEGNALFTGYFEPELEGARVRGGPYQTPLHRKPDDLGILQPYHDRAAIMAGALDGRGLEIYWLKDPVEAFFLEIQGSGRIRLPDGSVARVGYADKNGHSYHAIGRTLVEWEELALEDVTAESIKQWARDNPERRDALFATNASYVFFEDRPELARNPALGPIGAFGEPLPAGRAVAVDRGVYALGAPVWIDFTAGDTRIRRLVLALDVGGAIKGPRRADFFTGSGAAAGDAASGLKHAGRLIALVPKTALARSRAPTS